jgi:peptidoglycan/xylan/chitin deacetylase (PgdA/CDA1 family)
MKPRKKQLYLTIDDSPSANTYEMVDFLVKHSVPAILFARGAFMADQSGFDKIVYAIRHGFVIGNHSYNHERTSEIGFASQTNQIRMTQDLIDKAYDEAGHQKPPQYFRFPHLDRGCGNAWVIDFNTVEEIYRPYVQSLFWDGVRLENKNQPTSEQIKLKNDIQLWLKDNNFERFSPPNITLPWWVNSELSTSVDMLMTFSTSDWMVTPRHKGKWIFSDDESLLRKIEDDTYLSHSDSAHIILMHDDREDSLTIGKKLITYFKQQNFEFLSVLEGNHAV